MALVYFDSSAFVKLLAEEAGSELAAQLWDGCDAAVASRLAYSEVRAALAAAVGNRDLDEADLDEIEQAWDSYWAATRPVELTAAVERHAGQLAGTHALRGAEAIHLASALAIGDPDLVLATWGRRLHAGAQAAGLSTAPAQLDTPIPAVSSMQSELEEVPSENGRRARHVAAMRARLVEVSLDLYDRQGLSATTIDQIAAAAKIHRSTFFRYFESKEGVLLAPLARWHRWFLDALGARPAGEPLVRSVAVVCTEGEWPAVERAQLQKIRRIVNDDPLLRVAVDAQLSPAFTPLLVERLRAMNPDADDGEVAIVSSLAVMWSNAAFSRLIEHGGTVRTHFAEVIGATRKVALETPGKAPAPAGLTRR
jgi:AcrR family transcriptional regulator/predicted nucleic acid-binding protein